ncbi:MAG: hypothetical protein Q8R70_04270, partial [Methanoregula sp.]|nr:hypothetical protein [Methanoregula sp.]
MKPVFCTLILLIICIIACGCTEKSPAVPAPVTPVENPVIPGLSDSHPNVTFSHDPGVIVVSFRTDGAQKMELVFSNLSQGYLQATEFSTSNPFAGSVAFQVPMKDNYQLNITSNGRWTANVTPLVTTNPRAAPVNLSGSGTMVSPVFSLEKGEYFFSRNETGLASPYYFLYYVNGTPLMDVNNSYIQPGFGALSPHPFVFITVPDRGTFYLSVLG